MTHNINVGRLRMLAELRDFLFADFCQLLISPSLKFSIDMLPMLSYMEVLNMERNGGFSTAIDIQRLRLWTGVDARHHRCFSHCRSQRASIGRV